MNCTDCDKPLGKCSNRKGTRCRRCTLLVMNRSEELRANNSKRARKSGPFTTQRVKDMARSPEALAKRSASAIANYARMSPEERSARSAKAMVTRFAWCPPGWREEYRRLTQRKKLKPHEAKEVVLKSAAEEARRTIAAVNDNMRAKQERERAQAY